MTKVKTKGMAIQKSISAVFTTIAQVQSISGPDAEVQTADITTLDGGVGMEHGVTGFVEGGTVTFTIFLDPVLATHQAITDDITTPASSSWKIIFADSAATEWPFTGIIKSCTPSGEVNGYLTAECSVKLSGIPTYPT